MHKRLFGVEAKKIGGDTGYAGTANRDLCKELGIHKSERIQPGGASGRAERDQGGIRDI